MKNSGGITISLISRSQASTNKNLQQEPNFQLCSSVIFVLAFSTVLFFLIRAEFTSELRLRAHLFAAHSACLNQEPDKASTGIGFTLDHYQGCYGSHVPLQTNPL